MSRTPLAPARWQTSEREAAATRRPKPRPPHRPAGTRGADDLAGRPGPTGRSENEPYPARPGALADLRAGGSRHQAAETAAAASPRRDPRRRRPSGSPRADRAI